MSWQLGLGLAGGLLSGIAGMRTGQLQRKLGTSIMRKGSGYMDEAQQDYGAARNVFANFNSQQAAIDSASASGMGFDRGQYDSTLAQRGVGENRNFLAGRMGSYDNRQTAGFIHDRRLAGEQFRAGGFLSLANSLGSMGQNLYGAGSQMRESGYGTSYNAFNNAIGMMGSGVAAHMGSRQTAKLMEALRTKK